MANDADDDDGDEDEDGGKLYRSNFDRSSWNAREQEPDSQRNVKVLGTSTLLCLPHHDAACATLPVRGSPDNISKTGFCAAIVRRTAQKWASITKPVPGTRYIGSQY
jgi:hypothetical protein